MAEDNSFVDLIRRVRAGEQGAIAEVIDRYGDTIRRTARLRLAGSRLHRVFDSMDIFQSVMKSFLFRVADEDSDWRLDTPAQLINLLLRMTENTLTDKTRRETSARRGGRHGKTDLDAAPDLPDPGRRPDEDVAARELAEKCWAHLAEPARHIYRLRFEDQLPWHTIAALLGDEPEAVRKRFERDCQRVRKQMGDEA